MSKKLPFTTLLLATRNTGKTVELRNLLGKVPIELINLSAFDQIVPVEETGATFCENAEIKASAYAKAANMFAVADDSGLEVFALDGEPGVRSARYGGHGLSDIERTEFLLENMKNLGSEHRDAQFTAAISFANPDGKILFTCDAVCRGSIATKPSGNYGFGYDSVFVPDGYNRSFGELTQDVKNKISHRSSATHSFIRFLLDFTGF